MRPTLLLAGLLPFAVQAQTPSSSRIDEVLVYPGGAQVTRLAAVAAGARELVLHCLTARFDPDTLQLSAPAGVNLGPVQIETLPRERMPDCGKGPLDEDIRKLEARRDAVAAELGALDTGLGYLKALGSGEARGTPAAGIAATADSIRKAAQDALARQAQLRRQQEELDKQLAPLQGERDRLASANPQWRSLRVRLSTAKEAELKLSYRVTQAGWAPSYRALLDTASGALTLERLAQVSQQSGEDWSDVKLRLSTAQATPRVGVGLPRPWSLDLYKPQPPQAEMARAAAMPAPPPMARLAAPASVAVTGSRIAEPELERFDLSVFQGSHAAEFTLPLRVNIASGTQRASLTLGTEKLQAKVIARVQPQAEAAAYLVTDLPRPAGSWPRGSVQLLRDGALVGSSTLNVTTGEERLELPFGRDDGLRVQVEPEQKNAGNTGFIGVRAEHRYARGYVVENRHANAVTLQLVEAAPVSQHEDIKVQTQFSPTPATQAWRQQPGLALWEQPLAAGQSQRFLAEYLISAPKEAQVTGLR